MIRRFIQHADKALLSAHLFLWAGVTLVWIFAWRVQPAPMGPSYRFASQFIGRVDALISPQMEQLAIKMAMWMAKLSGADLGLTFAILFGCLILLGGTLQWFLMGRLIQWTASKYGQTSSLLICVGISCWLAAAIIPWAMSW
jgi:hypothetical protein